MICKSHGSSKSPIIGVLSAVALATLSVQRGNCSAVDIHRTDTENLVVINYSGVIYLKVTSLTEGVSGPKNSTVTNKYHIDREKLPHVLTYDKKTTRICMGFSEEESVFCTNLPGGLCSGHYYAAGDFFLCDENNQRDLLGLSKQLVGVGSTLYVLHLLGVFLLAFNILSSIVDKILLGRSLVIQNKMLSLVQSVNDKVTLSVSNSARKASGYVQAFTGVKVRPKRNLTPPPEDEEAELPAVDVTSSARTRGSSPPVSFIASAFILCLCVATSSGAFVGPGCGTKVVQHGPSEYIIKEDPFSPIPCGEPVQMRNIDIVSSYIVYCKADHGRIISRANYSKDLSSYLEDCGYSVARITSKGVVDINCGRGKFFSLTTETCGSAAHVFYNTYVECPSTYSYRLGSYVVNGSEKSLDSRKYYNPYSRSVIEAKPNSVFAVISIGGNYCTPVAPLEGPSFGIPASMLATAGPMHAATDRPRPVVSSTRAPHPSKGKQRGILSAGPVELVPTHPGSRRSFGDKVPKAKLRGIPEPAVQNYTHVYKRRGRARQGHLVDVVTTTTTSDVDEYVTHMSGFFNATDGETQPTLDTRATPRTVTPDTLCNIDTRIVDGIDVANELQWVVFFRRDQGGPQFCSGVYIGGGVVLTAAHCVDAYEDHVSSELFYVCVGNDVDTAYCTRALGVGYHEYYDERFLSNDIGVVFIEEDSRFKPLCFPIASLQNEGTLYAYGFGTVSYGGPLTDSVQYAVLTPVPNQECTFINDMNGRFEENIMFCAFGSSDTCSGDSGGPVIQNQDGVFRLVGLTSFGYKCDLFPGFYVRLSAYTPWLNNGVTIRSFDSGPPAYGSFFDVRSPYFPLLKSGVARYALQIPYPVVLWEPGMNCLYMGFFGPYIFCGTSTGVSALNYNYEVHERWGHVLMCGVLRKHAPGLYTSSCPNGPREETNRLYTLSMDNSTFRCSCCHSSYYQPIDAALNTFKTCQTTTHIFDRHKFENKFWSYTAYGGGLIVDMASVGIALGHKTRSLNGREFKDFGSQYKYVGLVVHDEALKHLLTTNSGLMDQLYDENAGVVGATCIKRCDSGFCQRHVIVDSVELQSYGYEPKSINDVDYYYVTHSECNFVAVPNPVASDKVGVSLSLAGRKTLLSKSYDAQGRLTNLASRNTQNCTSAGNSLEQLSCDNSVDTVFIYVGSCIGLFMLLVLAVLVYKCRTPHRTLYIRKYLHDPEYLFYVLTKRPPLAKLKELDVKRKTPEGKRMLKLFADKHKNKYNALLDEIAPEVKKLEAESKSDDLDLDSVEAPMLNSSNGGGGGGMHKRHMHMLAVVAIISVYIPVAHGFDPCSVGTCYSDQYSIDNLLGCSVDFKSQQCGGRSFSGKALHPTELSPDTEPVEVMSVAEYCDTNSCNCQYKITRTIPFIAGVRESFSFNCPGVLPVAWTFVVKDTLVYYDTELLYIQPQTHNTLMEHGTCNFMLQENLCDGHGPLVQPLVGGALLHYLPLGCKSGFTKGLVGSGCHTIGEGSHKYGLGMNYQFSTLMAVFKVKPRQRVLKYCLDNGEVNCYTTAEVSSNSFIHSVRTVGAAINDREYKIAVMLSCASYGVCEPYEYRVGDFADFGQLTHTQPGDVQLARLPPTVSEITEDMLNVAKVDYGCGFACYGHISYYNCRCTVKQPYQHFGAEFDFDEVRYQKLSEYPALIGMKCSVVMVSDSAGNKVPSMDCSRNQVMDGDSVIYEAGVETKQNMLKYGDLVTSISLQNCQVCVGCTTQSGCDVVLTFAPGGDRITLYFESVVPDEYSTGDSGYTFTSAVPTKFVPIQPYVGSFTQISLNVKHDGGVVTSVDSTTTFVSKGEIEKHEGSTEFRTSRGNYAPTAKNVAATSSPVVGIAIAVCVTILILAFCISSGKFAKRGLEATRDIYIAETNNGNSPLKAYMSAKGARR